MKKIFAAIALTAGIASAQSFIRTHTIVSDNSTFPKPENVEWMQGESVRFEITAKSGNFYIPLSNGVAPVLKMWSGNVITQLYAQKTGSIYNAGSGKLYVDLLANEANISPSGAYNYAVGVYDGTQYMGVVAQGRATVRAHPFGASVGYVGAFNAFPYVPTNDAAYLGGITGAVAGANVSIARTGRTVYISSTGGGGGSGTFTNFLWGTNSSTAQGIVAAGSNNSLRSAGGTNYLDGTLFSTLYTLQNGGGLSISQASGPTAILTVTNSTHLGGIAAASYATGTPLYVQSETNASARLASNVWAAADSTTNYVRRTGDTMSGSINFGISNNLVSVGLISFGIVSPPLSSGAYIGYGLNGRGLSDFVFFQEEANGTYFDLVNPVTFSSLVIGSGGFSGSGSGLTDLPIYVNGGTVAQTATGTVITVTGGGGGSVGNQRSFEWRDNEGSALVGWTKQLAVGVNQISVRTATNRLTFAAYATTAQTTTQTNDLDIVFEHSITGAIPFVVRANQPAGVVIFTAQNGQASSVAITQTISAASTTYVTNLPLSIEAKTATVSVRIATTNAVNLYQVGVDVQ